MKAGDLFPVVEPCDMLLPLTQLDGRLGLAKLIDGLQVAREICSVPV